MQFNRDEQGNMNPLPKPSVDTGMGLERMAAVMQHVHSNYEIDLFQDLLKAVARETGAPFSMEEPSLKVIADHIRSCSFLIADGVLPSNEDAATYCAASSAAPCATVTNWVKANRSSTNSLPIWFKRWAARILN